jgi:hypothetical protein
MDKEFTKPFPHGGIGNRFERADTGVGNVDWIVYCT